MKAGKVSKQPMAKHSQGNISQPNLSKKEVAFPTESSKVNWIKLSKFLESKGVGEPRLQACQSVEHLTAE